MNELLKSMVCSGSECFCWILVLLNIFALFYLVFCSFWKVSKLVKISGWVYLGILIGSAILTLFFHTCIYTLLATIFTAMMLMAILSILLPQQGDPCEKSEKEKAPKPMGAYVIFETFDGWFTFGLYDAKRKNLVNSTYAYRSMAEAKEAIASCAAGGVIAQTEDRTGLWIQERYIPKFEISKYGEMYGFSLHISEEDSIIHSEKFRKIGPCLTLLEKVKANIGSADIYMSVEKICGDGYKKWQFKEEEPVVEAPVPEEVPISKKCIVGVVWPESSNPDRIYRYQMREGSVAVGDIVTALTVDTYNKKEVVRKARVVSIEYYAEGENIVLPTKHILSVEKN